MLDRLFDWQGRAFLSEEHWSFQLPLSKDEASSRISSRIVAVPRLQLHLPFLDYQRDSEFRGTFTRNRVAVKPPRMEFLGNLFGLNQLFYFAGKLSEAGTGSEISGQYKIIQPFRAFLIFSVNFLIFVGLMSAILSALFAVRNSMEQAVISMITACLSVFFLALLFFIGRVIQSWNRPSRDALFVFFSKLT